MFDTIYKHNTGFYRLELDLNGSTPKQYNKKRVIK